MIVLPTGPENALALLSLAAYHTTAPVNASCTAAELREDATRLNARAVVTTKDVAERLELRALRQELQCEVVFVEPRTSGPSGLFDMSIMGQINTRHHYPTPFIYLTTNPLFYTPPERAERRKLYLTH
ncbi:hypothetical protein D9758_014243 [Tetrapyrgos nigripes]|uniref:Uncharacterized protein n=1 Tax=Tetrapyrgos nigripes TaxID=182062 RepID=A0A8H5CAQ0_9AGAR|nr:hypothetical protein D9758_014243 [Tetrapyrgos nigripes]